MRKVLLTGLCVSIAITSVSCGEDEHPLADLDIPDDVFTRSTAVAIRTTGVGVTPNSSYVRRALAQMMANDQTFTDFVMRGGLPESGSVEADIAGTAPQQVKGWFDDGAYALDDAVDDCGNPQLMSFVTPDVIQEVVDASDDQIMNQDVWPRACDGDIDCDTTREGQWGISFSELRSDGHMDLIVELDPLAGSTTTPAYQGNLLGYLLPGRYPIPLYANARKVSLSGFGMVRLERQGISLRPSTLFQPTEVYVFPPDERELGGMDVQVALISHDKCEDDWNDNYDGPVPFGCAEQKPLMVDRSTPAGQHFYEEESDDGQDQTHLDTLVELFEYQLKTALACPDVSSPGWQRIDVPGGSVEIFECPDGDVDLCIAFHDMEDAYCEWDAPPPPPSPFMPEPDVPEDTEVTTTLPVVEGNVDEVSHSVHMPPGETYMPFDYQLNGQTFTLQWTETKSSTGSWNQTYIANELNALEQARSGGDPLVEFVPGDSGVRVKPRYPLGPLGTITMGTQDINGTLGLSGQQASTSPAHLALDIDPYTLTSEPVLEDAVLDIQLPEGYARIDTDGLTHLYTDEHLRVLALYDSTGNEIDLPEAVLNTHCEEDGQVRFDLSDLSPDTYYIAVSMASDGGDTMRFISTSVEDWLE